MSLIGLPFSPRPADRAVPAQITCQHSAIELAASIEYTSSASEPGQLALANQQG